jgi:hypothetical protein
LTFQANFNFKMPLISRMHGWWALGVESWWSWWVLAAIF